MSIKDKKLPAPDGIPSKAPAPFCCKTSTIVLINKTKGNLEELSANRPLSILEAAETLLDRVIKSHSRSNKRNCDAASQQTHD